MNDYNVNQIRRLGVRLFFMWLCVLAVPPGVRCMAQAAAGSGGVADSVRTVFSGVLYFSRGNADWIEPPDYKAVGRFLRAALNHPQVLIRLRGWADTTGTVAVNRRVSARRAAAVGRYLMRNGVDSARIRTEGCGEDAVSAPQLARRVEMWGVTADVSSGGTPSSGVSVAGKQADGTAEVAADSVRTVFSGVLHFSRGNADWIELPDYKAVGRFLRAALSHPQVLIRLRGWADTTGTVAVNRRVSARRAAAVGRYLMRNGVDSARIRTEGCGEDTVSAPQLARRVEMWGVTADVSSGGTPSSGVSVAGKQADGTAGISPRTRPEQQQKQEQHPREDLKQDLKQRPQEAVKQKPEYEPAQLPQADRTPSGKVTPSSGRYLAVKTNLAAWAGTIMNIATDVQVGKHVSVEFPLLWCPWYVSERHAVRTFTLQPEVRWWLRAPGAGHFFGLHAHVGWFNVRWDRDRYQDTDRPLFGAGVSYGCVLPLGEHWAGEFTLGAGYANMRYDTYYNIGNGSRIDTRTRNYWGITRAGLSVVYRFRLKK